MHMGVRSLFKLMSKETDTCESLQDRNSILELAYRGNLHPLLWLLGGLAGLMS